MNDLIKQQNEYLKQLKIDDKETMKSNEKISEIKTEIEKERINFKKSMFSNQMNFESNTISIDEEFVGSLIQETFDFTVIF